MASIKDVAKRAGVGVGTVSRVLNSNGYQNNISCNVFAGADQNRNYMEAVSGVVQMDYLETWSLKK